MDNKNVRLAEVWEILKGFQAQGAHHRLFAAFADTDDTELRQFIISRWLNSFFLDWSPRRLLDYAISWHEGPSVDEFLEYAKEHMSLDAWIKDGWFRLEIAKAIEAREAGQQVLEQLKSKSTTRVQKLLDKNGVKIGDTYCVKCHRHNWKCQCVLPGTTLEEIEKNAGIWLKKRKR
jgi:hypothetical protein